MRTRRRVPAVPRRYQWSVPSCKPSRSGSITLPYPLQATLGSPLRYRASAPVTIRSESRSTPPPLTLFSSQVVNFISPPSTCLNTTCAMMPTHWFSKRQDPLQMSALLRPSISRIHASIWPFTRPYTVRGGEHRRQTHHPRQNDRGCTPSCPRAHGPLKSGKKYLLSSFIPWAR